MPKNYSIARQVANVQGKSRKVNKTNISIPVKVVPQVTSPAPLVNTRGRKVSVNAAMTSKSTNTSNCSSCSK